MRGNTNLSMEDLKIVRAIKKGDSNAFKELFKKYYDALVNYVRTYANDLQVAEDITQQVFITLWTERNSLQIDKSVKGYLYTTSYRAYIDYYRKTKRRDAFIDELKEKTLRDSILEDKEITENRINRLKSIINTLPPKCKEVVELHKLRGLKYQEIAERLNISKKTVESQMRIAYAKIREGFEKDNIIMFFVRRFFPKYKSLSKF